MDSIVTPAVVISQAVPLLKTLAEAVAQLNVAKTLESVTDRQIMAQQALYEQQRRDLLAEAKQRHQDALGQAEHQQVLQDWPLRLHPAQLLGAPAADGQLPLKILLSMPQREALAGRPFDIQLQVRNRLQQFLNTHYHQNASERPAELLDHAWKDPNHRGGASIRTLYERLNPMPFVVLEAELVRETLAFQFACWGPLTRGYEYQHLGDLDCRALLDESARRRARDWRATREQLLAQGHATDAADADRRYGGFNAVNLEILEQEERLAGFQGITFPPYQYADADFEWLYRHLTAWYCLATGLLADLHHFRYNDALPLLPNLLPGLLNATGFPLPTMTALVIDAYTPLADERPDLACALRDRLAELPGVPLSLLKRLEAWERAKAAAAVRAQQLAPQDMHGRDADFVRQRQRETAHALGLPVAFRDRLGTAVRIKARGLAGLIGRGATIEQGPEMVIIPAGSFLMGSPVGELGRSDYAGPKHRVSITRPFAIGRYAVTFDDYDAFCAATEHRSPDDEGWGRGRRPVIDVSWCDAFAYCHWLSQQTGREYRLPSEAEWEYACRAGTETPFSFGADIAPEQANYNGNDPYGSGRKGLNRKQTVAVGSLPPNPWGLHEMHGNVCEWCADWFGKYSPGPVKDPSGPPRGVGRVLRGGGWVDSAQALRAAARDRLDPCLRDAGTGLRLALGLKFR